MPVRETRGRTGPKKPISRRKLERDFIETCERLADANGKLQAAHAFVIALISKGGGSIEIPDSLIRTSMAENTAFTVERVDGGFVLKHVARVDGRQVVVSEGELRRKADFGEGVLT